MAFAELDDHFDGEIVRPGDPGYDDARQVWNGKIDRRPSASPGSGISS